MCDINSIKKILVSIVLSAVITASTIHASPLLDILENLHPELDSESAIKKLESSVNKLKSTISMIALIGDNCIGEMKESGEPGPICDEYMEYRNSENVLAVLKSMASPAVLNKLTKDGMKYGIDEEFFYDAMTISTNRIRIEEAYKNKNDLVLDEKIGITKPTNEWTAVENKMYNEIRLSLSTGVGVGSFVEMQTKHGVQEHPPHIIFEVDNLVYHVLHCRADMRECAAQDKVIKNFNEREKALLDELKLSTPRQQAHMIDSLEYISDMEGIDALIDTIKNTDSLIIANKDWTVLDNHMLTWGYRDKSREELTIIRERARISAENRQLKIDSTKIQKPKRGENNDILKKYCEESVQWIENGGNVQDISKITQNGITVDLSMCDFSAIAPLESTDDGNPANFDKSDVDDRLIDGNEYLEFLHNRMLSLMRCSEWIEKNENLDFEKCGDYVEDWEMLIDHGLYLDDFLYSTIEEKFLARKLSNAIISLYRQIHEWKQQNQKKFEEGNEEEPVTEPQPIVDPIILHEWLSNHI